MNGFRSATSCSMRLLAPKSSTVFTTFWAWICLFSLRLTEQIRFVQFSSFDVKGKVEALQGV